MQTILSGIIAIIDKKGVLLAKISFFFKIYIAASLLLMKLLAKLLISGVPKLTLHELAIFAKCFIRCLTKHLIEVSECASEVFYNS